MNPIIFQIGETKNFLDFQELYSGIKICLNKSEFIKAVEDFKVWRQNLQATNFSSDLFRLMSHADPINMRKILTGFPVRASVYLLWYHSDTEQEFYDKWENVEIKDPEIIIGIDPATNTDIITNPSSEFIEDLKQRYNRQKYLQDRKAFYGDKN